MRKKPVEIILCAALILCSVSACGSDVQSNESSVGTSSEANSENGADNEKESSSEGASSQTELSGDSSDTDSQMEQDDQTITVQNIEIPDPVAYFQADEDSVEESLEDDGFTYVAYTSYDTLDMLEEYAELLISDFNFTKEEYEIYTGDPGDVDENVLTEAYIELSYEGNPENGEIFIRFMHNVGASNTTAIATNFANYTIVEAGSYAQDDVVITLPNPDTVLGISGDWYNQQKVQYTLSSDAQETAASYIDLLISDYDFKMISSEYDYELSEVADYFMTADLAPDGDVEQGKITIIAASIDDDDDYIYIYLSNLSGDADVTWSDDVSTASSSEASTTQGDDSGNTSSETTIVNSALSVQNPEDYFGTTPTEVGSTDETVWVIFKFKTAEDGERAYEEYSELLLEKFAEADTGYDWLRCFTYTGDDGVYGYYKSKAGCTVVADLYYIDLVPNELQITFSKDLTIADLGERPSTAYNVVAGEASLDEALGGSTSSGTSTGDTSDSSSDYEPNIAEFAEQDCSICHGTGKCTVCGGDGYLWSSASDKEDRNCWRCNNSGKCTYCDGTGKRSS